MYVHCVLQACHARYGTGRPPPSGDSLPVVLSRWASVAADSGRGVGRAVRVVPSLPTLPSLVSLRRRCSRGAVAMNYPPALNLTPGADMTLCLGMGLRGGAKAGMAAALGVGAAQEAAVPRDLHQLRNDRHWAMTIFIVVMGLAFAGANERREQSHPQNFRAHG